LERVLSARFFDRDPQTVAKDLIGKVLRHRIGSGWLSVQIVEVEAYYRREKGSHASLGRTQSREALFMPAGTIYMYYARGLASLNVSCRGPGNAVLLKAGRPSTDVTSPPESLERMQRLNPGPHGRRPLERLCAGQTLLCRALDLRVAEWNRRTFDPERFFIEDVGYVPRRLIQARRLGIPRGRDEHLLYRFIDLAFVRSATSNPLTKRGASLGSDFRLLSCRRPAADRRRPRAAAERVGGGLGSAYPRGRRRGSKSKRSGALRTKREKLG
jgi:DNA-3-methyladenine glycosylase